MKTRRSVDLKAQVVARILARRSDHISRMADRMFREVCADPVLEKYIVSLPLSGLPKIRQALSEGSSQPRQGVLEEVVHNAMKRDWRQLSPATINRAADTYVSCLRSVLSHSVGMSSAGAQNVPTNAVAHQVLDAQH